MYDVTKRYRGGRPVTDLNTGSRACYDKFRKEFPNIDISWQIYNSIIREINLQYITWCLESGHAAKLPYGLGNLFISKRKPVKKFTDENGEHSLLPIDWNESAKQGKTVYHLNHHTDGYRFRWFWHKADSRIKSSPIWKLYPAKKACVLLKEYLTKPEGEYFQKYYAFNPPQKMYKQNHG